MRIEKLIILTRKLDIEPTRTFHLTIQEKKFKTVTKNKQILNFYFKLTSLLFQIQD